MEDDAFDRGKHHRHGGHHGLGSHHGRGGHHGHGRHGFHSSRKLSSSDLQSILLALLANRPAHGYELIRALEDHSYGLYVPSPGMIYPALTYLEEIGYASVEMEGNKKRYHLTEAGQANYAQNREIAARLLDEMARIGAEMARARQAMESGQVPDAREYGGVSEELETARYDLRNAQRREKPYSADEAQRVTEILTRAAAEIRALFAEPETP